MAKDKVIVDIISDTTKSVKSMAALGGATALAMKALSELVKLGKESVKARVEQVKAETKLTGALKATGGALGIAQSELHAYASELQKATGIGDEMIISAQAMLTTFSQVGKEVFPEAIERAADMSKLFGQDLTASVQQLGTALQDPMVGLTRLRRVGITFTEAQKESIKQFTKQNNIMGAQRIILDELESQFGGVARELGTSMVGSIDRYNAAMGDLKELTGETIDQFLRPFRDAITEVAQEFVESRTALRNYVGFIKDGITSTTDLTAALAIEQERLDALNDTTERYVVLNGTKIVRGSKAFNDVLGDTLVNIRKLNEAMGKAKAQEFETNKLREQQEETEKLSNLWLEYDRILDSTLTPLEKELNKVREDLGTLVSLKSDLTRGSDEWRKVEELIVELLGEEKDIIEAMNPIIEERTELLMTELSFMQAWVDFTNNQIDALGRLERQRKEEAEEAEKLREEELEREKAAADAEFWKWAKSIGDRALLEQAASEERLKILEEEQNKRDEITGKGLDTINKEFEERKKLLMQFASEFQIVFDSLGEGMINALTGAEDAWQSFGEAVKGAIAAMVMALGKDQVVKAAAEAAAALGSLALGPIGTPAALAHGAAAGQHAAAAALAFAGAGAIKAIPLAEGGLATKPTLSLIGEAGPEAVIPFDKMSRMGAGNITINVQGDILTEDQLLSKVAAGLSRMNNGN